MPGGIHRSSLPAAQVCSDSDIGKQRFRLLEPTTVDAEPDLFHDADQLLTLQDVRCRAQLDLHGSRLAAGIERDAFDALELWREALGPLEVFADADVLLPFYGMADLPFTCAYGSVAPTSPAE